MGEGERNERPRDLGDAGGETELSKESGTETESASEEGAAREEEDIGTGEEERKKSRGEGE